MGRIKGPVVSLPQFMQDKKPYNNVPNIGQWFADLGYRASQVPGWDSRMIDLDQAAESTAYCEDYLDRLQTMGLELAKVAGYLPGQVLAVHPAYEVMFEGFHPPKLTGNTRTEWAQDQLKKCILASEKLGPRNVPVLSGGFAWQMVHPWPQHPEGIIEEAFRELAERWWPILDMTADRGRVIGFELHPGSDVFDGKHIKCF